MNLLRRCFDCGQPLGKKEPFCPRCGAKQPREPKKAVSAEGREGKFPLSRFPALTES